MKKINVLLIRVNNIKEVRNHFVLDFIHLILGFSSFYFYFYCARTELVMKVNFLVKSDAKNHVFGVACVSLTIYIYEKSRYQNQNSVDRWLLSINDCPGSQRHMFI